MTTRQYIGAMSIVLSSVVLIPEWEWMLKVYVISVVTLVTALFHVLFRIQKIREYIVNRIVVDVMQELFKDEDFRALVAKKLRKFKNVRRSQ